MTLCSEESDLISETALANCRAPMRLDHPLTMDIYMVNVVMSGHCSREGRLSSPNMHT